MMLPTRKDPRDWETFRDRETDCDYFYNPATGESRWAGSAADQARAALQHAPRPAAPAASGPAGGGDEAPLTLELASPRLRDVERAARDVFADDDDDADGAALTAAAEDAALDREWRARGMLRTVRRRRRAALSCGERACDRCLAVLEIGCCEQPAALLEAAARGPLYVAGAALLLAFAALACASLGCDGAAGGRVARRARAFFREGVLFCGAALTLAVPDAAACVYRGMPLDDGDWDVRGLPTVVGVVDPRRFWAFALGRCALANNGFYDPGLPALDWPWAGAVLHPPRAADDAALAALDAPTGVA